MNKSIIHTLMCCALSSILFTGCGGGNAKREAATKAAAEASAQLDSLTETDRKARIKEQLANLPEEPVFDIITTLGTIRVKLYSDTPKHRDNFAKLAFEGFYDGILFHRVIPGFMIQTGDPLSKDPANKDQFGTGGPGYNIPAEMLPTHHHIKGALAAARRGDRANPLKESSGSQFYIVHDPTNCVHLDGEYSIFGETVDGIDVIDKIASVQTDYRDCPLTPVKIIKINQVVSEEQANQ